MNRMYGILALLLLAALTWPAAPARAESVTLHHVHGLAFNKVGTRLMVPAHTGLAIYEEGRWSIAPGPQHDYMGFAMTRDMIYSSGHPAPGSGLTNPFGLIRSGDEGKTWGKLGLEGESDFHLLAAGYENSAIYVYNPQRNSKMDRAGIYYTLNFGLRWHHAEARGLAGQIAAIAVHPRDAKKVAVATKNGVYLSTDSGTSFKPLVTDGQGLAVFFDLDGKELWASTYKDQPALRRFQLAGKQNVPVALPPLVNDAVSYVAQNPKQRTEYAIATFERSIYLSRDGGKSWKQIADRGQGK